jgi:hypothetical protein
LELGEIKYESIGSARRHLERQNLKSGESVLYGHEAECVMKVYFYNKEARQNPYVSYEKCELKS